MNSIARKQKSGLARVQTAFDWARIPYSLFSPSVLKEELYLERAVTITHAHRGRVCMAQWNLEGLI